MSSSENVQSRLKRLKADYARQLPEKIAFIEKAVASVFGGKAAGGETEELIRMVHTLGGSASSLGFRSLGSVAKRFERYLKDALSGDVSDAASIGTVLSEYIGEIKSAVLKDDMPLEPLVAESVETASVKGNNRLIYLVEDDGILLESLCLHLSHFGYIARGFERPVEMTAAVDGQMPSAIISDVSFPEGEKAGIEAVLEIRKKRPRLPVLFMSGHNDLDARLDAVRAGGDAYLLKPLNPAVLLDKLDSLISDAVSEDPYRILIIDDDPDLAAYYSLILDKVGMKTEIVTDPLGVMSPLIEFNPDLILMDMYMPGCNGLELAKVIRQIEAFVSIPIVFLSAETDIDKQLNAMRTGGDDFLTKPIEPNHLISSIGTRAQRMRIIRSFMDRDSLTGLLNHTKTKENLDSHLERSRRSGRPISFAMIDIDKFKSVNDTYGHPTGDRVILSLSRLLQQRLRRTDILGRYGGEEFAAVLLETDSASAAKILDEIRQSFSMIRHKVESGEFSVTFSCGIASFPGFEDPKLLCNAADKALYDAKNNGRNRVVIAPGC